MSDTGAENYMSVTGDAEVVDDCSMIRDSEGAVELAR